jgi:4-alpha-glucanotransferase
MAIKNKIDSSLWINWDEKYKLKKFSCDNILNEEISFQKFIQYLFYSQWRELKKYANKLGIKIIGDIPIYVSLDSSDAWSCPELFQFDNKLNPSFVAGCPPDGFSKKGQLWGNPLYDWQYHKDTSYDWWKKRFKHSLNMYDGIRIDHFRGFDQYYSIPYGSPDACNGEWKNGPSYDLFNAVKSLFEGKIVIAEDLGFITDSVRLLLSKTGFMSTKVIEFAFDKRDNDMDNVHMPHNYIKNCVSYTSTHDNETLVGWLNNLSDKELLSAKKYVYDLSEDKNTLYKSLIATCLRSCADLCIIPIQDILGLDNSSRINTPSTTGNNWTWRIDKNLLTKEKSEEIRDMISTYCRINLKKHQFN